MSIDERMNDVAGSKAIELKDITKRFGSVVANYKVSLSVNEGEILSILGEKIGRAPSSPP